MYIYTPKLEMVGIKVEASAAKPSVAIILTTSSTSLFCS